MKLKNSYQRIVCITEESVETLFHIEEQHRIVGVSAFVKRPPQAQKLPKVSFFTSAQYEKIKKLQPDLIIGHSDIQKTIAHDLIEQGYNVFIANHRSLEGVLQYIYALSCMVESQNKGLKLIDKYLEKIGHANQFANTLKRKPKVYFEEWDDPQISAIEWVSELIELCGGESVTHHLSQGVLAKDRVTNDQEVASANPDIIFGCWCGKKVKISKLYDRFLPLGVAAAQNKTIFELMPEVFLQPGPALFEDGIDILMEVFAKWNDSL